MKQLVALLPLAALVAGCPSEAFVPSGADTRDFRITFEAADASPSCPQSVLDEANNFEAFDHLYRFWFPEGLETESIEVWWRFESDSDADFSFFARGTFAGTLTDGFIEYAGGPYTEARESGEIRYTIEGSTRVQFADSLPAGVEQYVISDSTSEDAVAGCTYSLDYTGQLLAEGDGSEDSE